MKEPTINDAPTMAGKPPFTRGDIEYQIKNTAPAPLNLPTDGPPARGSGALAASPGRAGALRLPQGNKVVRAERVKGKARDGGKGKVSRKKMIIGIALALLAACAGGVWWWKGRTTKVQLWEGGPYWADRNIGASAPEDYGLYFWWGDTVGYKRQGDAWVASNGSKLNFSFEDKNTPTAKKRVSALWREDWITEDNVLAPEHDAAQVQWGNGWRMPTKQELDGLHDKCEWTWTKENGVAGYVVRGKGAYASASIFLPCAGYGDGTSLSDAGTFGSGRYWSSVPSSDNDDGWYDAWYLDCYSDAPDTDEDLRKYGYPVRPVQEFIK